MHRLMLCVFCDKASMKALFKLTEAVFSTVFSHEFSEK